MSSREEVQRIKRLAARELLRKANVVGVGIGYKEKHGLRTQDLSLVVLVEKKLPLSALAKRDVVPSEIRGVATDVKQVGRIVAYKSRTERWRPAPPGVSIGHWAITAGTFGAVVRDAQTGERLILSNNHVLANSNQASPGDAILQPGPADGGQNPADRIAELLRFVPIQFETGGGGNGDTCSTASFVARTANLFARLLASPWRLVPVKLQTLETANRVDAAVARPVAQDAIEDAVLEIGEVHGTAEAELGLAVRKSGRTTGLTTGTVQVIDATVRVGYGAAGTALFENQIVTGNMSAPGDSGSLLVEQDGQRAVGLLFAGSDQSTIFNPIAAVESALSVVFD